MELLSVEISLDSDSQKMDGKQNGGAWCTGGILPTMHHIVLVENNIQEDTATHSK